MEVGAGPLTEVLNVPKSQASRPRGRQGWKSPPPEWELAIGTAPWTPKITKEPKNIGKMPKVPESPKSAKNNDHRVGLADRLASPSMTSTFENFKQILGDSRKQLAKTVKAINKLCPKLGLTTETPAEVIIQSIKTYGDDKKIGEGTNINEMLRSILAIYGFLDILSKFHDKRQWSSISTSVEMIKKVLDYISASTDNANVPFNGSEFFLDVQLNERSDAITALLVCSKCCRVDPDPKGPHRFAVMCIRDPMLVAATQRHIGGQRHIRTI